MDTDKYMTIGSMVLAGILTLLFLLDLAIKVPFSRASLVLDIMMVIGGAFVLWQGYEAYREIA
jgi:hypothetical protein